MNTTPLPRAAFLLWPFWMAALGLVYITTPPSPDQSQFDWMAFTATRGLPYYVGSFDMNWPGAMWLHELGIRLFGVHAWTWRLTDFLLLLTFTLAGGLFLVRAGWRLAGALFLLLYPPLYVTAGGWMAGQRDIVAAGFLLAACAASMPGGRREGLGVFLAGALVTAAVLVRPTYLSFLAGLLLLEALPLTTVRPRRLNRISRAVGMLVGFALALGIAIIAGVALGNIDDWYEQSILFSLSVYVGAWPQDPLVTLHTLFVRSWHWITLLALAGAALWVRRNGASHALALALGIVATCALSFVAQGKGFGYHLGGVLPVLVLLSAIALDGLSGLRGSVRPGAKRAALTLALVFAAGLVAAGTAKKLSNVAPNARLLLAGEIGPMGDYGLTEAERRAIVETVRTGSGVNDTVAVYGDNYDLAYRAERLPSYRFFTPAADQISREFLLHDAWIAEIDKALVDRRPAFVIIARKWIEGDAEAPQAREEGKPILEKLLAHLKTGYTPVFENPIVILYQAVEL